MVCLGWKSHVRLFCSVLLLTELCQPTLTYCTSHQNPQQGLGQRPHARSTLVTLIFVTNLLALWYYSSHGCQLSNGHFPVQGWIISSRQAASFSITWAKRKQAKACWSPPSMRCCNELIGSNIALQQMTNRESMCKRPQNLLLTSAANLWKKTTTFKVYFSVF